MDVPAGGDRSVLDDHVGKPVEIIYAPHDLAQ